MTSYDSQIAEHPCVGLDLSPIEESLWVPFGGIGAPHLGKATRSKMGKLKKNRWTH